MAEVMLYPFPGLASRGWHSHFLSLETPGLGVLAVGEASHNIRNQATLGPPGCEKIKRWGETLENKMRQERGEEQDAHGPSSK